jgi:hypothetical protein
MHTTRHGGSTLCVSIGWDQWQVALKQCICDEVVVHWMKMHMHPTCGCAVGIEFTTVDIWP